MLSLRKLRVAGLLIASAASAQNNSEQIVFSGTGQFTYTNQNPDLKAFGFWIWC